MGHLLITHSGGKLICDGAYEQYLTVKYTLRLRHSMPKHFARHNGLLEMP